MCTARLVGSLLAGLVAASSLAGCRIPVHTEGPTPGQHIQGVVLVAGDTLEFAQDERVTVGDSVVVAAGKEGERTWPFREIDHVIAERFSLGHTLRMTAVMLVVAPVLLLLCDEVDVDPARDGLGMQCADPEDDGFD